MDFCTFVHTTTPSGSDNTILDILQMFFSSPNGTNPYLSTALRMIANPENYGYNVAPETNIQIYASGVISSGPTQTNVYNLISIINNLCGQ